MNCGVWFGGWPDPKSNEEEGTEGDMAALIIGESDGGGGILLCMLVGFEVIGHLSDSCCIVLNPALDDVFNGSAGTEEGAP